MAKRLLQQSANDSTRVSKPKGLLPPCKLALLAFLCKLGTTWSPHTWGSPACQCWAPLPRSVRSGKSHPGGALGPASCPSVLSCGWHRPVLESPEGALGPALCLVHPAAFSCGLWEARTSRLCGFGFGDPWTSSKRSLEEQLEAGPSIQYSSICTWPSCLIGPCLL